MRPHGGRTEDGPADRPRDRSPNLDGARIDAIVRTVRRLRGKASWDAVVSAVEDRLGCRYTRQALFAHPAIRLAYQERRFGEPAANGERPVSERARAAARAKASAAAELAEVRRREEALLERIAIWMYNAHANGIPLALLDARLGGSRSEAAGMALVDGTPDRLPRPGKRVPRAFAGCLTSSSGSSSG